MAEGVRSRLRPLRAAATAAALAVAALSCSDGTGPEGSLRLLFDTATITPDSSLQLVARDAQGEVVWTSDDPSVATVVGNTGWVTGVSTGSTVIRADDGVTEATARIDVRTPPLIRVAQPTVDFEAVAGGTDPEPVSLAVTNDGQLPLTGLRVDGVNYGAGEAEGWLSATLDGTTAPTALRLAASVSGLAPGIYTATLAVSSEVSVNGPQSVAVTLRVLRPPSIVLDRTTVELGTTPGEDSAPVQVEITNGGDAPLTGLAASVSYDGAAAGWLVVQLDGTAAPATLTVRAQGAGLAEGTYTAEVEVTSGLPGVAARTLEVVLVVAPGPAITLSSTALTLSAVVGQGSPPARTIQVGNGGGGTLDQLSLGSPTYGAGASGWLTVSLSGPTAPATVTVAADSDGLAPGTYTASFAVASPVAENSPRTVDVTLVVDLAPVIAISPSSWEFVSVRGQGDPPSQGMQITNTGGGVLSGLSVQVAYQGSASGWLDLTLGDTQGPTTLVGQARVAGLQVGIYTATVTITSDVPGVAPRSFPVQYEHRWSFQVDIQPFFTTAYGGFGFTPCTNCHVAGGNAPDLSSAAVAYQALVGAGRVIPGDPDAGVLICKIEGRAGCGTPMPLPLAQINRIREWIAQGAER